MARRVFMHVGTPKSGTTFLQSVWWANQERLLEQGLLLPGAGIHEHYWATCDLRGEQQLAHVPAQARGSWERLLGLAAGHRGDVLISHELFSPAPRKRVGAALRGLGDVAEEVHVVLTARDLARQIPAEWQQRVKHGRAQTYPEFLDMIRRDPSVNFWQVQDVPAVLDRWSQGVPPERVHLVVIPPPGGPREFLWDRICALTGVDGSGMTDRRARGNESLGLVEAETLRRLSAALQEGMSKPRERLLKDFVAERIMRTTAPEKIVVPPDTHAWAAERARQMVEELSGRGYDVIGELADLVPAAEAAPGRQPDEVTDTEVAQAAVRALVQFVHHEEGVRRRRSHATPPPSGPRSLLTRARRRAGRWRRRWTRG